MTLIVSVLIIIAIVLTFLVTGSFASCFFLVVILAIGNKYCNSCERNLQKYAKEVFYITFSACIIVAIIRALDIQIPDDIKNSFFKSGGDEDDFFEKTEIAARLSFSGLLNVNMVFFYNYGPDALTCLGYNYYIGTIAFVSQKFLDGNCVMVQLLGSVLPASLISISLFKIFALYFPAKKAKKYAVWGSVFTAFIYFSSCLLRDIHVAFLFTLVFYIVLQPYSRRNLYKLIVIVVITATFRVWSALFMAMFMLNYVYKKYNNSRRVVWIIGVLALAVAVIMVTPIIGQIQERLAMLTRNVEYKVVAQSPYLTKLYQLPSPVKESAIIMSSYMTPFTAWNELTSESNIFHNLFKFTTVVYEFYWFLVIWLTLKWIILNKGLKKLPTGLPMLLLLVVAYMFFSVSEFTVRRTMCMYPIIYLGYVYIKETGISKSLWQRDLCLSLAYYMMGLIVFVLR